MVKARSNWDTPDAQIRSKQHTRMEMADLSLSDLPLPSPSWVEVPTAADNILYSFDRKDTPDSRPLTLDVFVKEPDAAKETEKLVAKEYEVLDGNGESVKGKKAKKVLNTGKTDLEERIVEDDGFELV